MAFYKDERIALFIDGANLYSAAKTLNVELDYRRLLSEFRKKGRLLRANYYTALVENEEYSPIRPLVDWLQYNGYNVVTKPAKEFTDSAGRRRVKGDMDVEIAVDMLTLSERLDHVVLFSGDGDLTVLVKSLQDRGLRVSVVSSVKTQPPMISDDLRRAADNFIDLNDLVKIIGRENSSDEELSEI
ncbi:LabA-like NYN domain-containing protein [Hirschia maritima]|uniref:LabA-like NYN domain-containing protein n=1 Tax=Hirschia maritima TaxID=1121961 RepID=UPI00035C8EAD|nr:NYN domain-containing protein [Hirschia maritima]